MADSQWNLGSFYYSKEAWELSYKNYYKAHVNFEAIGNDLLSGKMLFNMANVQNRIKDYTGCEITTYKAIRKFVPLNNSLSLYRCYNLLGLVSRNLSEYDKAIKNNNKALEYLDSANDNRTFREGSYSNTGLVYQDLENYKEAIKYFKKALKREKLRKTDLNLYARLVDNLTYNRFLNGEKEHLEKDFLSALHIRDSVENVSGIVMSKLHLSEYYAHKGHTVKAVNYAKDALGLAASVNNNKDWLTSLKLLSKIDENNANRYLGEYVTLNDSLQIHERLIRNKFTRISFETDQYVEETERLTIQNTLIFVIGIILVLVLALLYFLKRQHSKTKELLYEKSQQNANEEIYSLMLKQQSNLEEGRYQERSRISEELHDGILGKLFGTRIGLGFLSIKGDQSTIKKYKSYIDEIQHIEKEIRDISHELKNEILSTRTDFISMIEDYVSNQCKINNLEYDFNNDDTIHWVGIDDKVKVNIYRIIQEAIQNVIKHARAKKISISFYLNAKKLNLVINDDGIGFNIKQKNKGIGLKNMHSRILKAQGEMIVDAKPNFGTNITILIPI